MLIKAVFLDRDGVLNESIIKQGKPYPPSSLNELKLTQEAKTALGKLKRKGFLLIGCTNQPDVARGTARKETVLEINRVICQHLPLVDIRVCFHDDVDNCNCRKPKPGLLTQAAKDYAVDLKQSFMIGDRWKDIDAGKNAECKTVWLKKSYNEKQPQQMDYIANTLMEAADWICSYSK